MYLCPLRNLLFGLSILIALSAAHAAVPVPAPAPPAESTLTLEEALSLAAKNNGDLQAARERLRGSYSDVEKAMAALLPVLSAQGRLTFNVPEVSLTVDQSGAVFSSAYQNAQILDLQQATGTAGARGQAAAALYNTYCQNTNPNQVVPAGVQQACATLQNSSPGSLDMALNAAVSTSTIVPQVQVDGILNATMPLVVPAAYPALKGARLNFASQQKQLEVTEAQLLTSVATAFYTAAGNDELVEARRHAIEVAQKTAESTQLRMTAGLVNRIEVMRADLARLQAEQRLADVLNTRAAAYRTLATLCGIEADSFKVRPPAEPQAEVIAEQQLVQQALDQRPELRSAELQERALGQQVLSSRLGISPTLSLFSNLRLTNATSFSGLPYGFAIGLQLDWLIFDGFLRDANRHNLESQRKSTLFRLAQLRRTVADEVINGRRLLLTKKAGLQTAVRLVALAQETLELARKQYQAGVGTQLDLLNAQDALIVAEVTVAQARFDLSLADLNLHRLTGEPLVH
jgi:OMF family outer membrane factor